MDSEYELLLAVLVHCFSALRVANLLIANVANIKLKILNVFVVFSTEFYNL